jgi:hypothetical protein
LACAERVGYFHANRLLACAERVGYFHANRLLACAERFGNVHANRLLECADRVGYVLSTPEGCWRVPNQVVPPSWPVNNACPVTVEVLGLVGVM